MIMSLSPLLLLGAVACRDLLTAVPGGDLLADALGLAAEAPVPRGGAHFELTFSGRDDVDVRVLAEADDCGPLRQVVVGSPRYDRQRGLLVLPIALKKTGSARLRAPARLHGWTDSLIVADPPGLAQASAGTYARFATPDTVLGNDAARYARSVVWRFDTLLVAGAPAAGQVLAGGATSDVGLLEMPVHQGVRRLRVALWAEAVAARQPVPAVAPDSIPQWVTAEANIVSDPARAPVRYAADVIWVEFHPTATQQQRQDAVDAVDGEVIGGLNSGEGEGQYLIRLRARGEFDPLARAVDFLSALPQVNVAMYHILIARKYRMPQDSGDFSGRWSLSPDSSSGSDWALEDLDLPMVGVQHRWSGGEDRCRRR